MVERENPAQLHYNGLQVVVAVVCTSVVERLQVGDDARVRRIL